MNSEILSSTIQNFSVMFMNLLVFLFFRRIYKPRYNRWVYVLAYIITSSVYILINYLSKNWELAIINTIFLFIHMNLTCILLFDCTLKKSLMFNSLYIVLLVFVDVVMVVFWYVLDINGAKAILSDIQYTFISYSTTMLITFFAWHIYISILVKKELTVIKYKETILVGVFTLFAAFVEYNFAIRMNNNVDGIVIIFILLGFLLLNIYIVYYNGKIAKAYVTKHEFQLIQNQNKLQLDHYIELNQKYEDSRKIIHDIKKHMSLINSLNENINNQAKEYGYIIEKQVDSLFYGFQCSNKILSIIMSQKITLAESKKILVTTNIEDILFDFMEDIDITAIFANLWDNAIEACLNIEENERLINIIVGRVNDFIIISFENSFNGNIIKKGDIFISTKNQHEGIGLSIIKSSVEKYNGFLNMDINDIFKIKIMIPVLYE